MSKPKAISLAISAGLAVAVFPFLWYPPVLGPALALPGIWLAHALFGRTDAPESPAFLAIFVLNATVWSAVFLAGLSTVRFIRRPSGAA